MFFSSSTVDEEGHIEEAYFKLTAGDKVLNFTDDAVKAEKRFKLKLQNAWRKRDKDFRHLWKLLDVKYTKNCQNQKYRHHVTGKGLTKLLWVPESNHNWSAIP